MAEFPGVYRATFLNSNKLGNVTCMVPAVTGNVPVTAMSVGMTVLDVVTPGALGWVVFEGGDPSFPVWMGTAHPAIDTTVWHDDHLRTPIVRTGGVNETRGNTVVAARYRIKDGWCEWHGHYILGTTTFWAAGALTLVLPVNPESANFATSFASIPGTIVRGYNGGFFPGYVEYNGGGGLGTVTCLNASQAPSAAAAWSTSVPFTWGNGHILSWNLRYPVS